MRLSLSLFAAAFALSGCGVASQFEPATPNGYSQIGGEKRSDIARYDSKPPPTTGPKADAAPANAAPVQTQAQPAAPPAAVQAPAPAAPTAPAPAPAPTPRAQPAPSAPITVRPSSPPASTPAPRPTPEPAPAAGPIQTAPAADQPAPPPVAEASTGVAPSISQPLGPPPPRPGERPARPAPPKTGQAVASPAEVWDRLNAYLTDRGFLLAAGSDRAKGVLITEPLMDGARPLGQLADCGTNPFESPRFHTTAVEARITPNGSGSRLSVGAVFVEVRESAIRGVLVKGDCRSRGVLEGELLSLAAGGVPRP